MPELSPETNHLLSAMLMMAGLLVLVAIGIQIITVYRRKMLSRAEDEQAIMAEAFREAYDAGEIDTDEYRQIRSSMERGHVLTPYRPTVKTSEPAETSPIEEKEPPTEAMSPDESSPMSDPNVPDTQEHP